MTDLIRDLAHIDVPADLLEQINMDEVLGRFRQKFRRLDDLKKFREKHEQRNFLSRWWNNNELDDAQLDAQQLQAEFSKTLGQLMVISMLQSQRLEQQQLAMSRQQAEIKRQADSIEQHTGELAIQHDKLREQGEGLEKLVKEYFALRGLTQDGARKLIDIANEVRATKDNLLESFARQTQTAQERAEALERTLDEGLRAGRAAIEGERALVGGLSEAIAGIDAGVRAQQAAQDERVDKLDATLARLEQALREQQAASTAQAGKLRSLMWAVGAVATGAAALALLSYLG